MPTDKNSPIVIWNRAAQREETEQIYGERFIRLLYGSLGGRRASEVFLTRPSFSKVYGAFQSLPTSRRKIAPFIRDYAIPMNEYEEKDWKSFNDFFIRRFKPGMRAFAAEQKHMPACAEGRYFGYEKTDLGQAFPVKGTNLSPTLLLGGAEKAMPFIGGPAFIARLCPVDYHRYHYPDSGKTLEQYSLHGKLHSVNPIALAADPEIFVTNERQVAILETKNFGKLAYIEVGAMCVGKIVQSHPVDRPFERGDEKGYFLFGGSTVVLLGEPGRWKPDAEILEKTKAGIETYVKLGEKVASC